MIRQHHYFIAAILFLWIGGLFTTVYSQTLQAKVSLRADRLLPEDRQILSEIPRALESYINTYQWGDEDPEITIHCEFNLIVETVDIRNSEKIYRAQLIVSSQSGENFRDRGVLFPYVAGQLFDHSRAIYNSLLSIIDYYVYMVLGGELDTYILMGGSNYYDLARNTAAEGAISNYSVGWRLRQEELETITDGNHQPLREAKFYYYEGLFYAEEQKDSNKSRKHASKVVKLLDRVHKRRPNSAALKRFMDAHYQEFCTLFKFDKNRKNVNDMMRIDNRHREAYAGCGRERKL